MDTNFRQVKTCHVTSHEKLANFSGELGQIMTRYDFLWARRVIVSYVRTDFSLS